MQDIKIKVGSRVYLKVAVAGEPGVVIRMHGERCEVEWPDLEIGRPTRHATESLILDEAYSFPSERIAFGEVAA